MAECDRYYSLFLVGFAVICHGQQQPNIAAQREAMKKLEFLAGKWSGEASVFRGPGDPMRLHQTEEVQFKMDGVVLLVEGAGRNSDGQTVFREQTQTVHLKLDFFRLVQ